MRPCVSASVASHSDEWWFVATLNKKAKDLFLFSQLANDGKMDGNAQSLQQEIASVYLYGVIGVT
jgi:hypothetical protein